jgi:hypothetical protein
MSGMVRRLCCFYSTRHYVPVNTAPVGEAVHTLFVSPNLGLHQRLAVAAAQM